MAADNFLVTSAADDFNNISKDSLLRILQSSSLVGCSEKAVCDTAIKWLFAKVPELDTKGISGTNTSIVSKLAEELVLEVMQAVQLVLLSAEELAELKNGNLAGQSRAFSNLVA